jgi:bacillopeptidase F (M6 metalloprotease family)
MISTKTILHVTFHLFFGLQLANFQNLPDLLWNQNVYKQPFTGLQTEPYESGKYSDIVFQ